MCLVWLEWTDCSVSGLIGVNWLQCVWSDWSGLTAVCLVWLKWTDCCVSGLIGVDWLQCVWSDWSELTAVCLVWLEWTDCSVSGLIEVNWLLCVWFDWSELTAVCLVWLEWTDCSVSGLIGVNWLQCVWSNKCELTAVCLVWLWQQCIRYDRCELTGVCQLLHLPTTWIHDYACHAGFVQSGCWWWPELVQIYSYASVHSILLLVYHSFHWNNHSDCTGLILQSKNKYKITVKDIETALSLSLSLHTSPDFYLNCANTHNVFIRNILPIIGKNPKWVYSVHCQSTITPK